MSQTTVRFEICFTYSNNFKSKLLLLLYSGGQKLSFFIYIIEMSLETSDIMHCRVAYSVKSLQLFYRGKKSIFQ